jgi:poly-gamma-glutamate synthesis protein (capsule biosynthesis protein)
VWVTVVLGLAGDTMLGRKVGDVLRSRPAADVVSPELLETAAEATLLVLNLECCISERGEPWPSPTKPFFFRAPPAAVEVLDLLGVECVTLANNHALDYGVTALADTFSHLAAAGIAWTGAGNDSGHAREGRILEIDGFRLGVLGVTDHPRDYAAGPDRPGVAWASLRDGVPDWLRSAIRDLGREADAVLVTPHWGPNMVAEPLPYVRRAARELLDAGATLVAGHSAHVFHGLSDRVLFDLGDFLDDYATDRVLRNDLGLFFLVSLTRGGPLRVEAVPLELGHCRTTLAHGDDARWIRERLQRACARLGTDSRVEDGRVVVECAARPR